MAKTTELSFLVFLEANKPKIKVPVYLVAGEGSRNLICGQPSSLCVLTCFGGRGARKKES